MKHHKAMAFYDCLKFVNEAIFTVLVIGVSTYLAGEQIIIVGTVLTAYLSFTQLTTPLRELHRIFDELSESTVLAEEYFRITELPKDFSYEATSALDNTTEKHIQKAIEKLQKENNTTILSIAHRLTTLENCDNILVFDKGKIIQQGKYQELIEMPGVFQDMYNGILK